MSLSLSTFDKIYSTSVLKLYITVSKIRTVKTTVFISYHIQQSRNSRV